MNPRFLGIRLNPNDILITMILSCTLISPANCCWRFTQVEYPASRMRCWNGVALMCEYQFNWLDSIDANFPLVGSHHLLKRFPSAPDYQIPAVLYEFCETATKFAVLSNLRRNSLRCCERRPQFEINCDWFCSSSHGRSSASESAAEVDDSSTIARALCLIEAVIVSNARHAADRISK